MSRFFLFPGQGSQKMGMGQGLFEKQPKLVEKADILLGYSIQELCQEDPKGLLNRTDCTQPALYIVNALTYLQKTSETGLKPDFVAGHSLGEYNSLFAAGVFDFLTGLRLVIKRGEIMSRISGGGMAAVIGIPPEQIRSLLDQSGFESIDIANYNSPKQTVISGPKQSIEEVKIIFDKAGVKLFIPLKVSGAFHSRYMKKAGEEFETFLSSFQFSPPQIPVISNVEALPYQSNNIRHLLVSQISSPVRWTQTIQYFLKQPPPCEFEEIGPGSVLTGLLKQIRG
jgi:malonyl CoA-acyl carrier protein transacylase